MAIPFMPWWQKKTNMMVILFCFLFCLFSYDGYSLLVIFKCQRFPYSSSLEDQKLCVNTSQGSLKAHKLKFVCYSMCLNIHGLWTREGNNCLTFRGEISHKNNAHKTHSTTSGLGRERTKERETGGKWTNT